MLFCDTGIYAPGSEQGNLNGADEKKKHLPQVFRLRSGGNARSIKLHE